MTTKLKEVPPPEDILTALRGIAKLQGGGEAALREAGKNFQQAVTYNLCAQLDAHLAEAWDALESVFPNAPWRGARVILEICTGDKPYIKGFLTSAKIPAFEIHPEPAKKQGLPALVAAKLFSEAVEEVVDKIDSYDMPKNPTPGVPLTYYIRERKDGHFTPKEEESTAFPF